MVSLTTSTPGEASLPMRLSRLVQNSTRMVLSRGCAGIAACAGVVLVCCGSCCCCGVAAAASVEPSLPSSSLLLLWEWPPSLPLLSLLQRPSSSLLLCVQCS